ncbi:uncharacterized protein LOC143461072 [Clavelina lepadiformis]|uniref:uncharacterized protein LOC143461072 n=1 Tax=Clavelina lepadiformis TaxID=159417 RepID=UPI0040429EFE
MLLAIPRITVEVAVNTFMSFLIAQHKTKMAFTYNKSVLPVLPKPDYAKRNTTESIPLSAIEDKELRKKLRNRQSALAARERKKARMLELEKQVSELQETNRRVEDENQYLRARLEVLVRKCLRNGIMLDTERDLLCVRVPSQNQMQRSSVFQDENNFYANAGLNSNQMMENTYQQSQIQKTSGDPFPNSFANDFYKNNSNQQLNGKCGIQALGQRQQEILQTLSSGAIPQVPSTNFYNRTNTVCHTQNLEIKQEPVDSSLRIQKRLVASQGHIQSFAMTQQQTNNSGKQHLPTTSLTASTICSKESDITNLMMSSNCQMKRKENWDSAGTQSLPSIGSMLTLPTKRQRLDLSDDAPSPDNCQNVLKIPELSENLVASQVRQTGSNKPILLSPIDESLFEDTTENAKTKDSVQTSSEQSQATPSAFFAAKQKALLVEKDLSDILSDVDNGDENMAILDFQDIFLNNEPADSPLSGFSDSGLSMDDSFDWMTDNPIFDL